MGLLIEIGVLIVCIGIGEYLWAKRKYEFENKEKERKQK